MTTTIKTQTANKISDEGARALSEALKANTTLQTLNLGGVCNNNSKTKPTNGTTTTTKTQQITRFVMEEHAH